MESKIKGLISWIETLLAVLIVLAVIISAKDILVLISYSAANVIEVILYAIARKMLISSSNSMDILIGVIALALVFGVDKYLHSERQL